MEAAEVTAVRSGGGGRSGFWILIPEVMEAAEVMVVGDNWVAKIPRSTRNLVGKARIE